MSAYIAGRVAAIVQDAGEAVTLRRLGTPNVDVALKAKKYGASATTVVNGQTRATSTFLISDAEIDAAAWPGPPRAKDRIIDAANVTFIVLDCDSRQHAGAMLLHRLTVTSAA